MKRLFAFCLALILLLSLAPAALAAAVVADDSGSGGSKTEISFYLVSDGAQEKINYAVIYCIPENRYAKNLYVKITPVNDNNRTVKLSVDDQSIVSLQPSGGTSLLDAMDLVDGIRRVKVDDDGMAQLLVLKPHKVGKTTLHAETADGATASLTVYVAATDGFSLKRDSWPIQNSIEGLGIQSGFNAAAKIPLSVFQEVFGDSGRDYYAASGNGYALDRGLCYGLVVTAGLQYLGEPVLDVNGPLNETGFDQIWKAAAIHPFLRGGVDTTHSFPQITLDGKFMKTVQYYQLVQLRNDVVKYITTNGDGNLFELLDVFRTRETPIGVDISYKVDGKTKYHTIMLDFSGSGTSYDWLPKNEGDGWYSFAVWDPDFPYYANKEGLDLAPAYAHSENRRLKVKLEGLEYNTVKTVSAVYSYFDGTKEVEYGEANKCTACFYRIDTLRDRLNGITTPSGEVNLAGMVNRAVEVQAQTVQLIQEALVAGKNAYYDLTLDELPDNWGLAGICGEMDSEDPMHRFEAPAEGFTLVITDGTAIIRGNGCLNIVRTEGTVQFTVNADNDALTVTAQDDAPVRVVRENIYEPDVYTTVTLDSTLAAGQTLSVAMDSSENLTVSADPGVTVDVVLQGDGLVQRRIEDVTPAALTGTSARTIADGADGAPSDWAVEELTLAAQAGLITEHTAGNYTADTTRFQFAELVVNMVETATGILIEPAPLGTFSDTDELAVRKAYAAGIVNGMGDGTFAPDAATNREQIAAMISRAITYIAEQTGTDYAPAAPSLEGFTDRDRVSDWAVEGVGRLAANGIMEGVGNQTLAPKSPCTVEQSILLLYRLYKRMV